MPLLCPPRNFPLGHKVEGRSETRFFASLIIPARAQKTERAGTMGEPTNYLTLTDGGDTQHDNATGQGRSIISTTTSCPVSHCACARPGGRTWVYLFTKPGVKGTQRKTLGGLAKVQRAGGPEGPPTIAAGEGGQRGRSERRQARKLSASSWPRYSAPRWRPLIIEDGPLPDIP